MQNNDGTPRQRWQCPCGSGLAYQSNYDGHGIPLPRTCEKCHAQKMRGYRADIMDRYDCDEAIEAEDY